MLPLFSNCRFLCPATCALYETSFVLPPKTSNDFQKWSGPTNNLPRVELCEVLISQTQLPSSFLDLRSQRHIILVKKRNIFAPRSILHSFTYFCDFVYRLGVMSSWQNGNRPRTLASLSDGAREHEVLQRHRPHYLCLDSSTCTSNCTTVVLQFPLRNNYRTRKLNWSSVTQIVMQKTNFLITYCFTTLTIFFLLVALHSDASLPFFVGSKTNLNLQHVFDKVIGIGIAKFATWSAEVSSIAAVHWHWQVHYNWCLTTSSCLATTSKARHELTTTKLNILVYKCSILRKLTVAHPLWVKITT